MDSLLNHFANKDDLIDGMVDLVFAEIELRSQRRTSWRTAMRQAGDRGPARRWLTPTGGRSGLWSRRDAGPGPR
jgi:hypothetical protein